MVWYRNSKPTNGKKAKQANTLPGYKTPNFNKRTTYLRRIFSGLSACFVSVVQELCMN